MPKELEKKEKTDAELDDEYLESVGLTDDEHKTAARIHAAARGLAAERSRRAADKEKTPKNKESGKGKYW